MAASTPSPPESRSAALVEHYLPTNPIPFAIALLLLGGAMLAFPKAAIPISVVILLGALITDQQNVAKVHLTPGAPPSASIPATEQLLMFQRGTL